MRKFITSTSDLSSGTGGVETPRVLILNPTTSDLYCYINMLSFGTNVSTNNNIFRLYADPTITSNGTPMVVKNAWLGAPGSPKTQVYLNPTVSGNGTIIANYIAGPTSTTPVFFYGEVFAILPGHSLLIAVRPNTSGVTYSVNLIFEER